MNVSKERTVISISVDETALLQTTDKVNLKVLSLHPLGGKLAINLHSPENYNLSIYNYSGRVLKSYRGRESKHVSLKSLSAGIYLVNLSLSTQSITRKIVVK